MPFGSNTYLIILTLWALPILILQWLVAGRALWRARRLLVVSIALCTVYLSAADGFAIARGIWQIHPGGVTGIRFGSHLPLEEALFYFLTVTMSAQGFIMIAAHFKPRGEKF
jgi:15-cis-phytoene synthase/lycopene beta-cyclase